MSEREVSPLKDQIASENLERLRQNPYPGRVIVIGTDTTGQHDVQLYAIMGRSVNSRNRVFEQVDDVVRTAPFNVNKVEDASLIIYNAMRVAADGSHIVSNGDQTDTIYDYIKAGESFHTALGTRDYEPDAPNYTPRISGHTYRRDGKTKSGLHIIKKANDSMRKNFEYNHLPEDRGFGRIVHTYRGDGNPLPSFEGPFYEVPLHGNIDDIAKTYWDTLNHDNRVSLSVKVINKTTGEVDYRIVNRYSKPDYLHDIDEMVGRSDTQDVALAVAADLINEAALTFDGEGNTNYAKPEQVVRANHRRVGVRWAKGNVDFWVVVDGNGEIYYDGKPDGNVKAEEEFAKKLGSALHLTPVI